MGKKTITLDVKKTKIGEFRLERNPSSVDVIFSASAYPGFGKLIKSYPLDPSISWNYYKEKFNKFVDTYSKRKIVQWRDF